MIYNYLKIACRNLLRNPLFTTTNLLGLTVGILTCIMITMYVSHELSYEKWNAQADRTVRTMGDINFGGKHIKMATAAASVGPDTEQNIPGIQSWCRIRDYGSYLTRAEQTSNQNITIRDALHVDSSFFNVFPIPVLLGDADKCLAQPNTVVLSEATAERLFGSGQLAMGKNIVLDDDEVCTVTAVCAETPENTHFQAEMLISLVGNREIAESPPYWASNNNFHTYFLLEPTVAIEDFSRKFSRLSREKMEVVSSDLLNMTLSEFEATGQHARYDIQPIKDIHLRSEVQGDLAPGGNIRYVWIFSFVAIFILVIAAINFINLTTARANQRAKEIGMRKVMGSQRQQLMAQFLCEALVLVAMAVAAALIISWVVLPAYNNLIDANLKLPLTQGTFWVYLGVGILLVGLLAGTYPAFVLSSFRPVDAFQHGKASNKQGHQLRNGLVIFQFAIATALILSSVLVDRQLSYIQNKSLGFSKEQILIVDDSYALDNQTASFKNQLLQNPAIESASFSSYLPIPSSRNSTTFSQVREMRQDASISMQRWVVDHDYMHTLGLELEEGRFLRRDYGSDSTAVVLNEAAVKILGYEDPIGKKIYGLSDFRDVPSPENFVEHEIIGVVKDFHFENMREGIGALGFFMGRSTGALALRYQSDQTSEVIDYVESTWHKLVPNQPFSYRFMDDSFAEMYQAEQRVGHISMLFTVLAILVSCLGLFGLSTFIVEQRTKEIGIRKVLGADVPGIVSLLSRDFLKLVLAGIVIAMPFAYVGLRKWLDNFAYHVEFHWTFFAIAALCAIMIAAFTVSFQSVRAALLNPVRAIRD
ncbi:MAG: ABC transporter permease [Saprospiraceae bacterium]|nr:ABC transporter permease [Saprospiraceae bacterium]